MLLVLKVGGKTAEEYVPGRCNIGSRGRAMRLATGLVILGVSAVSALVLLPSPSLRLVRLVLSVPGYVGLLSALEGTMSFCVFHASRGTYDFFERLGSPFGNSSTRKTVELEEWRRRDRRKARVMHVEAGIGAVLFGLFLLLI